MIAGTSDRDEMTALTHARIADMGLNWVDGWQRTRERIPEPPSTHYYERIFGGFMADRHALKNLDVGAERICFDTDYRHTDSTWPDTKAYVEKVLAGGNDITCFELDRR